MDSERWIRPVSDLPDGTLFDYHCRLDIGRTPQLFDVIRVPLARSRSTHYQPENWEVADGQWTCAGRLPLKQVLPILDRALARGPDLLGNQQDRHREANLRQSAAVSSLTLVEPSTIEWEVDRSVSGRRQTRAAFTLQGVRYSLVVTDPMWEKKLEGLGYGIHPRGAADIRTHDRILFTVSLGEPFRGYCYKLVAAVIMIPKRD